MTQRQNVEAGLEYVIQRKPTPNLGIEISKPSGVDDGHWAELTPKQKAVVAHRVMCISEYRKEMV
jgi:hypothetical protein